MKIKYEILSLLFITVVIILTSCGGEQTISEPTATPSLTTTFTPSPTSLPSLTSTPTFTPIPTITPTLKLPILPGTQIPASGSVISAENIDQVVELARWGMGVITDAVYSPDGSFIAVGSTLGVSIYETDSLVKELEFETTGMVWSLAYSPNGNDLAVGLNNGSIEIRSVSDGTLLRTINNNQEEGDDVDVLSVSFSPDGSLLASGLSNGYINLWQVSDGTLLLRPNAKQGLGISSIFFSTDGATVYSSSYDGTIIMRNVSDGQTVRGFSGKIIVDATLSADGNILAAFDYPIFDESSLIVWNVQTGKRLQTIPTGKYTSSNSTTPNFITSIALSPDSRLLAAAWDDHTVKVWDVSSGVLQNSFEDLQPDNGWYYLGTFTTAFSQSGESLLLAGADSIGIWNVGNGKLLNRATITSDAYLDISISPDGQILAAVQGPNVLLMQLSDGNLVSLQNDIQSNGSVDFLADGNTLAVSMFDKTARLWPLSNQGVRKTFEMDKKGSVTAILVSPDGNVLAIAGVVSEGRIELRRISDGLLISTITLGIRRATDMAFTQSGDTLIVLSDGDVGFYNVSDGKYLKTIPKMGTKIALSPDGTLLAGNYEGNLLRVWDTEKFNGYTGTGALYSIADIPDKVSSIIFSPDVSLLIVGYVDGTVEVRLVTDGTLLQSWKVHSQDVSDILFTPDGSRLITASYDGTIRMWGLKP